MVLAREGKNEPGPRASQTFGVWTADAPARLLILQ